MVDWFSSDAFVTATLLATIVWIAQSIVGPRIAVTIRRSVKIDAPIERVWRALDPFAPDYVPTGNTIRAERQTDDPKSTIRLHIRDPDTENERVETLERLEPPANVDGGRRRKLVMRLILIEHLSRCAKDRFPYGKKERQTVEAKELPNGRTEVIFEWRAHVRDPLTHTFAARAAIDAELRNARQFAEAVEVPGSDDTQTDMAEAEGTGTPPGPRVRGLVLAALSLVIASLAFGPVVGAMVMGLILVHEIGHAIAFRLVGERVLSITLLPVIAGSTVGTSPRTAVRDAFVSLGGVLFSAIVLLGALALIPLLDLQFAESDSWRDAGNMSAAGVIAMIALLGGIINLFQLFPIPFLDGGRVWLATMARMRQVWAHRVLALLSALVAAGCFWIGDHLIGIFALLLAVITLAPNSRSRPHAFAAPSWGAVATITLMYVGSVVLVAAAGVGGAGMRQFLSPPTFMTPAEFALEVERGQACRAAEGPGQCTAMWPLTLPDSDAYTPAEWFAAAGTDSASPMRGMISD